MAKYIDIEPVFKQLTATVVTDDSIGLGVQMGLNRAMEILAKAPIVEAEPVVHARWISEIVKRCDWKGQKRDCYQPYSCPVCHTPDLRKGESRYCSECGAKMDAEVVE